jgi:hypothetical protein
MNFRKSTALVYPAGLGAQILNGSQQDGDRYMADQTSKSQQEDTY